jgi:site-specific DNA-cytosine methylase/3'-phosphoadenosine 5'-phosphosulfate sulfotransferase (PAPS reductase)/FAD synthetase
MTRELDLPACIELTVEELRRLRERHDHWAVAWSVGKDSTTVATVTAHAIEAGLIERPKSLKLIRSDTRQELSPLNHAAEQLEAEFREHGWDVVTVEPEQDKGLWVNILGRGVVPPNSMTARWCTRQLKQDPMAEYVRGMASRGWPAAADAVGLRTGESATRDRSMAVACNRNGGECGQGRFYFDLPEELTARAAPIVHWKTCKVWAWLKNYAPNHQYGEWPTELIADAYGGQGESEEESDKKAVRRQLRRRRRGQPGHRQALGRGPRRGDQPRRRPRSPCTRPTTPDPALHRGRVEGVDPRKVTGGRPVGLLWASPDCKHFSRAKGGKPVEKSIRSLAWVVVKWAAECRPRVIILENVREFEDWGPLCPLWECPAAAGRGPRARRRSPGRGRRRCPRCESPRLRETADQVPDPARKGLTFKQFVGRLRGLGYAVEWKVLNAADYGAPTHRRRLFLVARNDGRRSSGRSRRTATRRRSASGPVRRPPEALADRRRVHRLVDPVPVDLRPQEAAGREDAQGGSPLGIKRYVLDNPRPFLVSGAAPSTRSSRPSSPSTSAGSSAFPSIRPCPRRRRGPARTSSSPSTSSTTTTARSSGTRPTTRCGP